MNKAEAIIASITYVLNLIDEELTPEILTPVAITPQPHMSYKHSEFLAVSLYYQLRFLEENYNLTFYTLNPQYLFAVKSEGIIKAFVYGNVDIANNELLLDSIHTFKKGTGTVTVAGDGFATRYIPLIDEPEWKKFIDPTLILYAGLPIRFHYKTVYYSVATIIEELMGCDLMLIAGTKLDGFIKRAKNTNIEKRILVF